MTVGVTCTGVHGETPEVSHTHNWNPVEGAIQLSSMWVGSTQRIFRAGVTAPWMVIFCWQVARFPFPSSASQSRVATQVVWLVILVVVSRARSTTVPQLSVATG